MSESAHTRAVARVVGVTAALGVIGVVATAAASIHEPIPSPGRLIGALVALLVADLGLVSIRRGGSRHVSDWDEAAWVLGLLIVPAAYVTIMAGVIAVVINLLHRRPIKKVVFNSSLRAIAGTVAMLIVAPAHLYQAHADWTHVFRPAVLPWLLAATLAIALIYLGLTSFAVAAERGRAARSFFGQMLRTAVANWARNVAAGLVIVAGLSASTAFTVVALAALIGVHFFLAERTEIKQERIAWKRLHTATDELRAVDLDVLMHEASTAAAVMMKADAAEVQLDERTGSTAVVRVNEIEVVEDPDQPELRPQHSLDVLLTTHEGPIGELRLLFTQPVVLTETERSCLAAFGNALSVALANALKFDAMRQEAERRVRAAYRDPVTGVGNLLMLEEEAKASLAVLEPGQTLVVVVIGLSRFAEVNDLLGAHAADQMLKAVAERLRGLVRRCDVVARLHGAEFVLLLRELSSVAAGEAQAALVARALHMPVHADGLDMTVDAHTGLAAAPDDGDGVEELVRRARLAMYQARTKDLPVFAYHQELEPPALAQVELLNDLSAALLERQLLLYYQPKFSLRSGQPVAAEALVRWQHPERGLIPPSEFIPLLERCGLVGDLTRYVLEASIEECARWRRMGMPLGIAVNLSARNLLDEDLPRFVLECLARHQVPADRLICEITETAVFSRSPIAASVLDQLRGAGISLSLDDFCTGYSSLSLLRERAIDEIKIDRSFVADLGVDNRTTQIVTTLIELAHRCGIIVTAEGIETPEQQKILAALDCDHAQGYMLAMPMPAVAARAFFTAAMANSNTSSPPRRALRSADSIGHWDDGLGWQQAAAE
jgi:diguanylate cyclase (GGDEF)-like protein